VLIIIIFQFLSRTFFNEATTYGGSEADEHKLFGRIDPVDCEAINRDNLDQVPKILTYLRL